MKQIPVLLLTGYLGSGKTTLLNRILSNKRNIKFAVIVNDIGEVNIDAELIQKGGRREPRSTTERMYMLHIKNRPYSTTQRHHKDRKVRLHSDRGKRYL